MSKRKEIYFHSASLLLYTDKTLLRDEIICKNSLTQISIHITNSSDVFDQYMAFSPALQSKSLKAFWGYKWSDG